MKNIEEIYQKICHKNHFTFDSAKVRKNSVFISIRGEKVNGNKFAEDALECGASFVIVDDKEFDVPGDDRYILTEDSLSLITQLARLHRNNLTIPIIGVVGSNGKTTTKDMLSHFLSLSFSVSATLNSFNSKIGLPISILMVKESHDFAVIEMGASNAGDIANLCEIARPTHGIITNISESHIGEFGSFEEIKKTKTALYNYLDKNNGTIFYNQNDQLLSKYISTLENADLIPYRDDLSNDTEGIHCVLNYDGVRYPTLLIGEHNYLNLLSVFTISTFFGIPEQSFLNAISKLTPSSGRSELVHLNNNVDVIFDAYNANKQSMVAGLKTLSNSNNYKIAILGDMKELGKFSTDHHNVVYKEAEKVADQLILVGEEFSKVPVSKDTLVFKTVEDLKRGIKLNKSQNVTILIKSSFGTGFFKEREFFMGLFGHNS